MGEADRSRAGEAESDRAREAQGTGFRKQQGPFLCCPGQKAEEMGEMQVGLSGS